MRSRPRLTYANVVATIALCFSVGGAGALAASQLAARSVGERQLRPGAVTADKIRKNAVTSPKIKALAIKQGKIAGGAVDGSKLADGAVGSGKLSTGAVTTEKLGDDAVTGEKVNEGTLGEVPRAASAGLAAEAESANPAAFALVGKDGALNVASSKGVAGAKELEAGVYCVTVSSFSPRGAQVTPQFNGVGSVDAFVRIGGAAACPSPQIEVQTWNGGSKVEAPFFFVAYR